MEHIRWRQDSSNTDREGQWRDRETYSALAYEIKQAERDVKVRSEGKKEIEDIEKWLRVSLPTLRGPFVSRPW